MHEVGSHLVKIGLLSEELRQVVQTQENRHPTQEFIHEVHVEESWTSDRMSKKM
jgi:hypothetical protein